MTSITACRICKSRDLTDVIDLGIHAITSRFPAANEPDPPMMPQVLTKCGECGLVQMKHTVPAEEMYLQTYGYRSGLNNSMKNHLQSIVNAMLAIVGTYLQPDDIVLDIGSNDATLLSFYTSSLRRIGIDPTGTQFAEYYSSDMKLVPDFFTARNFREAIQSDTVRAKCITSISMFYDLPDPLAFMQDVADVLDTDCGVWIMEQSYMPSMLAKNSFDTICHEHLEYYALSQIKWMADRCALRIMDVEFNECNGGSFRVFLCHEAAIHKSNDAKVSSILHEEELMGLHTDAPFLAFQQRCEDQKRRLQLLLKALRVQKRPVYLYGASTKGNTLLQYYGLDTNTITGAAERNPIKFGRRTPGTNIPIESEEIVRERNPDFMLVLPWHFREEFLQRERPYLTNGGQFIFPLPNVELISYRPKALITGARGQIGKYLVRLLRNKGYHVYGTTTQSDLPCDQDVLYLPQPSSLDQDGWRDILLTVHPDEVYHLSAETSNPHSIAAPIETLQLNGNSTGVLLELIAQHLPSTKFFHANSVEIFKGSASHDITKDSDVFYPMTPYGIAKLTSYWLIRYYREMKGVSCCSGILSNTESPLRKESYVTQKICKYLQSLRDNPAHATTLQLGSVTTERDWIHAEDAARAIFMLMQNQCDDIIASGINHTVEDWINTAIECLWPGDRTWVRTEAGWEWNGRLRIMVNEDDKRAYESNNAKQYHSSLLQQGWSPKSFKDVVANMVLCRDMQS